MNEIRSFLIGIVVAGVVLGIIALALGAFGGDSEGAPTARVIGTLPASATARATQRPATTALPTTVATRPASPTVAATTPATTPTAQATASAATSTPKPQPTQNPVTAYVNAASPVVTDLVAQIDYLVGQGTANPTGSTVAAGTVKSLAARLQGISAPACLSAGHATLTQGAGAAGSAADQLTAALGSSNDAAAQAALGNLSAAKTTLNQGAAAIQSATC
jgi:hypothetical protein